MSKTLQIRMDEKRVNDFKTMASDNEITQGQLLVFLVQQFEKSGTPQQRVGALRKYSEVMK